MQVGSTGNVTAHASRPHATHASWFHVPMSDTTATADAAEDPSRAGWRHAILRRRSVRCAFAVCVAVVVFHVALIALYRFVDPERSNLMLAQAVAGEPVTHEWVGLDSISPNLIKAVVMAEDARFCSHWGIDFGAIRDAIERADERGPRGVSTITMQTAKNLFLWNDRSYLRKALEVPVSVMMELLWPKSRTLEVYLNIVEWGPGVFGAEAAARHHFGRSAASLSRDQAARLAAALPNPRARSASIRGGSWLRRHRSRLAKRIDHAPAYAGCVLNG